MNPTDEQLMTQARRDDRQAFAQLVDNLSGHIYGLSLRMLGNEQDAKDAAQDTFVKMWQSRHRWSPKGKVSTWAYSIAMNTCINRLRSRKRWRMVTAEDRTESDAGVDIPIPDEESPDTLTEQHESRQRLEAAIAQLPPKEKAAILLRHQQGFTSKEVAKVLDTTVYGVDSLLFRARKRLRTMLADYM